MFLNIKLTILGQFVQHLEARFSGMGVIKPDVMSSLRRQIEAISEGYDLLGVVEKFRGERTVQECISDARALAEIQGYSLEVRLIPTLSFGYDDKGPCSVSVLPWSFDVYATRQTGNERIPKIDPQKIDRVLLKLLPEPTR